MWVIRRRCLEGDEMEWLREWIMQVAGITILGSACDMIMPDGEIKKYVRMVVGFVLVFFIIKPVVNITPQTFAVSIPQGTRARAVELKNNFDEEQQKIIFNLYREKLQKSVENEIFTQFRCDVKAEVEVEEKNEVSFGDIKKMKLIIKKGDSISEDELCSMIHKKFGVSFHKIQVEKR